MLHDAACPVSFVCPFILLLLAFRVKRISEKGGAVGFNYVFLPYRNLYRKK